MTAIVPASSNPYVGPRTFARSQSHLFFGRKREARDLLARIISERLLLFYAQSGAGKSSLLNTRIIPGLQAEGFDTYDADEVLGFDHDQRGFGFAADMLKQLGVSRVKIHTNNPNKIAALEAAGLEVVAQERVIGRRTPQNIGYLAAKRDRAGHSIDAELEPPLV